MIWVNLIKSYLLNLYKRYITVKDTWFFYLINAILWFLLVFFNEITIKKVLIFCTILCIIYIYKDLIYYINNKNLQENKKYLLTLKKENLNCLIYILIKISILNNLILFMIPRIELLIYNILKLVKNNKYISNCLYITLLSIFIIPCKIIWCRFYIMLSNFNNLTVYQILFKRVYGSVLSVLIFSDIIEFLVSIAGGGLKLCILVYIICVIIIIVDYTVQKLGIWALLKINIFDLYKYRLRVSLLCSYIYNLWSIIDSKLFIKMFGHKLNFEWLELLHIDAYKKNIIKDKLFIINKGDTYQEIKDNQSFLYYIIELKYNVYILLDHLVYFEYYKKYNLYKQDLKNDIIISSKSKKIQELADINYKIIQMLLYFIWDLELKTCNTVTSNISIKWNRISLDSFVLDITYFKKCNNNFSYIDNYGDLSQYLYLQLYELSSWSVRHDIVLENKWLYKKMQENLSINYVTPEFQSSFGDNKTFLQYAYNIEELLCKFRHGLIDNDKLEIELEDSLKSSLEDIKHDLLLNWNKQEDLQDIDILERCSKRVKEVEQLIRKL